MVSVCLFHHFSLFNIMKPCWRAHMDHICFCSSECKEKYEIFFIFIWNSYFYHNSWFGFLICTRKFFYHFKSTSFWFDIFAISNTAGAMKNTVVSPNFLVWKFCGNCAFPRNFLTRKLGKIMVFYTVICISQRSAFGSQANSKAVESW